MNGRFWILRQKPELEEQKVLSVFMLGLTWSSPQIVTHHSTHPHPSENPSEKDNSKCLSHGAAYNLGHLMRKNALGSDGKNFTS